MEKNNRNRSKKKDRKPKIRPIALAVSRRPSDHAFLLMNAFDSAKNEHFYRPLGGGIEFGETGEAAIRREMKEEINANVINLSLLKYFENIFTFNGKPGHEIVMMFSADLNDSSQYQIEKFEFTDGKNNNDHVTAVWRTIEQLQTSDHPLYPDGLINLLLSL